MKKKVNLSDLFWKKNQDYQTQVSLKQDGLTNSLKAEDELYGHVADILEKDIVKPDLVVYLQADTSRLMKNIKKRGRDYEQNIDPDYLEKINSGYLEFLKTQQNFNVKIIDISNKDFIEHRSDYLWLLNEIFEAQE